jgi:hypothetical protein
MWHVSIHVTTAAPDLERGERRLGPRGERACPAALVGGPAPTAMRPVTLVTSPHRRPVVCSLGSVPRSA